MLSPTHSNFASWPNPTFRGHLRPLNRPQNRPQDFQQRALSALHQSACTSSWLQARVSHQPHRNVRIIRVSSHLRAKVITQILRRQVNASLEPFFLACLHCLFKLSLGMLSQAFLDRCHFSGCAQRFFVGYKSSFLWFARSGRETHKASWGLRFSLSQRRISTNSQMCNTEPPRQSVFRLLWSQPQSRSQERI